MNKLYDENNIFAKILRSEISCNKIIENECALAFLDINPQAPIHVLVIPKNPYVNFHEFTKYASVNEVNLFRKLVNDVIDHFKCENKGFRLITNSGNDGNQDVPHFHVHILAGKNLGRMIK